MGPVRGPSLPGETCGFPYVLWRVSENETRKYFAKIENVIVRPEWKGGET